MVGEYGEVVAEVHDNTTCPVCEFCWSCSERSTTFPVLLFVVGLFVEHGLLPFEATLQDVGKCSGLNEFRATE